MYLLLHLRCNLKGKLLAEEPDRIGVTRCLRKKMARAGQCTYNCLKTLRFTGLFYGWTTFIGAASAPPPHSVDKSLHTTVFAVCWVPISLDPFPGYCSLSSFVGRIDTNATALYTTQQEHHALFVKTYNAITPMNRVRCPLDNRRPRVVSSQLCPLVMFDAAPCSNTDLLQLLSMALDLQQESGRPLPLLLDMKIHHQISKLLCSPSCIPFDVGSPNRVPIVHWLQHAYKYCVTVTWRKFLPLCTHLNTGSLEPV